MLIRNTLVFKTFQIILLQSMVLGNTIAAGPPLKQFFKLSRPEKTWAISHPFIALKAFKITQEADKRAKGISSEYPIADFPSGGQTDAFRHCYWMALLAQEIKPGKARSLGYAHEKGNYLQYKKGKTEYGTLPSKALCEMDIWNNNEGIKIGKQHKNATRTEMVELAMDALVQGRLLVVKMDEAGNFLTCEGLRITEDELRKWDAPKCLVPSNQP